MNINICLPPRIFFFRSRRDLFIFFDFFFFASRTARSGEFWFYSNLIFFVADMRLTQELRFDLFICQFASVRANICSVVFVFL